MRDRDVRNVVLRRLSLEHGEDHDTRIVEEMGIWSGTVRVDIAVINGELCGYELKSERDTLERLPLQLRLFSRVFDRVTLISAGKHIAGAEARIPSWWGITMAEAVDHSAINLREIRPAQFNPSPDPFLIAQLLWKDEALAVLHALGIEKGWRSKRIKLIHQKLADDVPLDVLRLHVRSTLKRRQGWLRQ